MPASPSVSFKSGEVMAQGVRRQIRVRTPGPPLTAAPKGFRLGTSKGLEDYGLMCWPEGVFFITFEGEQRDTALF